MTKSDDQGAPSRAPAPEERSSGGRDPRERSRGGGAVLAVPLQPDELKGNSRVPVTAVRVPVTAVVTAVAPLRGAADRPDPAAAATGTGPSPPTAAGMEEGTFRALVENAHDVFYRYRLLPTPAFEYVSPAVASVTGYTPEEHYANPQLGLEIVHPDDRARLAATTQGDGAALLLRWVGKDGRIVWTEQRNRAVRDASGRVVAIEGVARDVSERMRLQETAERTGRFREQLLGIVGHDLRGPLQAISASAHLLRRAGLPEKEARSVARIKSSADRMMRMIGDLLDFTRSGLGGTLPVTLVLGSARELCEEVVAEHLAADPTRDLALEPGPAGRAALDPDRLAQALGNLVGNALVHGERGGPVRVAVVEGDASVDVEVRNRGRPIPAHELPELFQPYRERRASRSGGLGLGLFIARQIALAHGGDVFGSSSEAGTTFVLRLPRPRR